MAPTTSPTTSPTAVAAPAPHVVVGGGLAGLVAATVLAAAGRRTLLLEGSGALGGRARSTVVDGHVLNLGPHALALRGPGTAVLRELDVPLPGGNPLGRPPRVLVRGKVVSPLNRRAGAAGLRGLAALAALAGHRRRDGDVPVAALLDALGADPAARTLLSATARLVLYADGEETIAADVLHEAVAGGDVRYLDGGWQRLVASLRERAVAAGVEVVTGRAVAEVVVERGRATALRLGDGERVDVAGVVLAVGGPAATAALLPGAAGDGLREHTARVTPARLACLDVALRGPVAPVGVVLGLDAPLYLSEHSRVADLAPDGGVVLHAARFLAPGGRAPGEARAQLEALVGVVVPDWQDRVVHARYLPDLVVTHDLPSAARGGIAARHDVAVDGVAGLALAGDWVGGVGTLAQAAIASARAAARLVQTAGRTAVEVGA